MKYCSWKDYTLYCLSSLLMQTFLQVPVNMHLLLKKGLRVNEHLVNRSAIYL